VPEPPKGAPNIPIGLDDDLIALYDDTGLASWSPNGGRINMPTAQIWKRRRWRVRAPLRRSRSDSTYSCDVRDNIRACSVQMMATARISVKLPNMCLPRFGQPGQSHTYSVSVSSPPSCSARKVTRGIDLVAVYDPLNVEVARPMRASAKP
jgi:hypothetical protein